MATLKWRIIFTFLFCVTSWWYTVISSLLLLVRCDSALKAAPDFDRTLEIILVELLCRRFILVEEHLRYLPKHILRLFLGGVLVYGRLKRWDYFGSESGWSYAFLSADVESIPNKPYQHGSANVLECNTKTFESSSYNAPDNFPEELSSLRL